MEHSKPTTQAPRTSTKPGSEMKRAAFYLLSGVIAFQLVIVAGVLVACFRTGNDRCTGDKVNELMQLIVGQSFMLYGAEKTR